MCAELVVSVLTYAGVSSAVAAFVGSLVTYAATALMLASVAYSAYMMASAEDAPKGSDAIGRLQTVRSSVQAHRIVYGEVMTGGVLVYAQSHNIDPAQWAAENGYTLNGKGDWVKVDG